MSTSCRDYFVGDQLPLDALFFPDSVAVGELQPGAGLPDGPLALLALHRMLSVCH